MHARHSREEAERSMLATRNRCAQPSRVTRVNVIPQEPGGGALKVHQHVTHRARSAQGVYAHAFEDRTASRSGEESNHELKPRYAR
eukprot:12681802-Alexandrium_andersonii.AAC.1